MSFEAPAGTQQQPERIGERNRERRERVRSPTTRRMGEVEAGSIEEKKLRGGGAE